MKVVAISDTHTYEVDLPSGDLLIIAGDITFSGTEEQIAGFNKYIESQAEKFTHKPIMVAGNHDRLFEQDREAALRLVPSVTYLEDEGIEIDGAKIYGSPWTPEFGHWSFMKARGPVLMRKWDQIPDGLDLLITHGPPKNILDHCPGGNVGCEMLRKRILDGLKEPPRVHVFGHIHEGYGTMQSGATTFHNASICNARYAPVNAPILFDL